MGAAVVVIGSVACEGHYLNALASVLYIRAINLLHCDIYIAVVIMAANACDVTPLNARACGLYTRAINLLHFDQRFCSWVDRLISSKCCAGCQQCQCVDHCILLLCNTTRAGVTGSSACGAVGAA